MRADFGVATRHDALLFSLDNDRMLVKLIEFKIVFAAFIFAYRKITVHSKFDPISQKLKSRAQLLREKAVCPRANIVIQVDAKNIILRGKVASRAEADAACGIAIVKDVAANIQKRH